MNLAVMPSTTTGARLPTQRRESTVPRLFGLRRAAPTSQRRQVREVQLIREGAVGQHRGDRPRMMEVAELLAN
jgi:hypothetical protein